MSSGGCCPLLFFLFGGGSADLVWECRYHHDGKHNVMATSGPIEIFGTLLPSLSLTSTLSC